MSKTYVNFRTFSILENKISRLTSMNSEHRMINMEK